MKLKWTETLIADFRRERDEFEYFKEKHAKNYSYVAALFAHALIFDQYSHNCVLATSEVKMKIHDEIKSILKNVLYYGDEDCHITIKKIAIPEVNSAVHFCSTNVQNMRGMSTNLVYYAGDAIHLLENYPWMSELPDYPNMFKSNYKNANRS